MANQTKKNLVETMMDAQKQIVDTVVDNTKKFTNGNSLLSDSVAKTSEWYNNWMESQKEFYNDATKKTTEATEKLKDSAAGFNNFYQNWFGAQMDNAKKMWETTNDFAKNMQQSAAKATDVNPMTAWTNMFNNWTNAVNNANTANNWFSQMQQFNPFNNDMFKKAQENTQAVFNQYSGILNNSFTQFQNNLKNGTTQEAFRNMVNVNEGFTRFYEMWAPLWKSIQEKMVTPDTVKQYLNPAIYKDVMDKYFGFMPENMRTYFQSFNDFAQNNMKQFGSFGNANYDQMRSFMATMPGFSANEFFVNMLSNYNNAYNAFSNAVSPLTKMVTPNQQSKNMAEWADINNRMVVYSIKNAELQYMIYQQGSQVLDKLVENVFSKLENGQEINSITALYQEWLNIGDKVYVGLFESDEYSKLMAEVSALQLRLRKDIEKEYEKMLTGVPVATRSEMDELYKTIYDLKKQVRQLEKMLELENDATEEAEEPKPAAAKTARKKTTA